MKTLTLGYGVVCLTWLMPVAVLLITITGIDTTTSTTTPVASKDDTCYEVTLADDSILDTAAELYYGGSAKWGTRKVPPIYTCPLKMVKALAPTGEAVYVSGLIFISKESGLMDDDEYAWSLAVHELVHYLQDLDGKVAKVESGELKKCVVENEAYEVQRQWLDAISSEWMIEKEDECL